MRFELSHWLTPLLSTHSAAVEYCNIKQISFPFSLNQWSTNLSLHRFDCLPIREAKERECWPSMEIPICRHLSNRHDRQMISDVEMTTHRSFSEQKYRSGAFSLIDRRKYPFEEQSLEHSRYLMILLYTLHTSLSRSECPMLMLHIPDKTTSCTNLHSSVRWSMLKKMLIV